MNFKFLNLGQRIKLFVNGVLAQTNTQYQVSDTIRIEKKNNSDIGEQFDEIKYQGYEIVDGKEIKSNIATIQVSFPPDKSKIPSSNNKEIEILNSTTIVLSTHISLNEAVDRIKIINFKNIGELLFDNSEVFSGKEIMQYNFSKLKFTSLDSGIGNPYQEIKYQVGNSNGYNSTIYSLKINIIGLASLVELFPPDIQENEKQKSIIYTLKVNNGSVEKTAKIKIETSLPIEVFTPDNSIIIHYKNDSIQINENGIVEILVNLDKKGEAEIITDIELFLENKNINGFLKFTLLDIDGDASNISSNNTKTLTLTSQ